MAGLLLLSLSAIAADARTITLTVGPSGQFKTINSATSFANSDTDSNNYYKIWVAAGTYTNDFSTITRPMTIEVDPASPGKVLLHATIPLPNEKGILLNMSSLTVNGLTFQGAAIANSRGGNGAGIRDQSRGPTSLIVRNSTFINNQEGILTGSGQSSFSETVEILDSRFINNGNPDPNVFQHGIYINDAASLLVNNSLFCGQLIGHDIKSRARRTIVKNSRIYDGAAAPADGCPSAGSTSFGIDTPNGGVVEIFNNRIIQGPHTENVNMIAYGAEGLKYDNNSLHVFDNIFSNTANHSTGIYDPPCTMVHLKGNKFSNVEVEVSPQGCSVNSPVPARERRRF
jgi:hypothetical protein